jgi:hypothetical protein
VPGGATTATHLAAPDVARDDPLAAFERHRVELTGYCFCHRASAPCSSCATCSGDRSIRRCNSN